MNQDGSGRTLIKVPGCEIYQPLMIEEDSLNRIAILGRTVYIIQPSKAKGKFIYRPWPDCNTHFFGNAESGFLASIERVAQDAIPELKICQLPGGTIYDQFPLVDCSDQDQDCSFSGLSWEEIQWSPNGQYLAFPAIFDKPSSDLYIYDIESNEIQRLTSSPDQAGQICWSPDSEWIVVGESLYGLPDTTSLLVVSVSNSEVRIRYSLEHPFIQGLAGWLDNERLLVFEGSNFYDALDLPANNLRLVDIGSGEIITMFDGSFWYVEIVNSNDTIALYGAIKRDDPTYEQGIYLVSVEDATPHLVEHEGYFPGEIVADWNEDVGLFVTNLPSEEASEKRRAFDSKGSWQCIQIPLLPDSYPSPDGKWNISLRDGIWLEGKSNEPIQVSSDQATQAIWCPNSSCFFHIANQILYHVSLPDLDIKILDDRLEKNKIVYQWLE